MEDQQFLEKVSLEADEVRFSVDTLGEAENWARDLMERGYSSERLRTNIGDEKIREILDKQITKGQRVVVIQVKEWPYDNILGVFLKNRKEPLHPNIHPVEEGPCARCGGSCGWADGPGPAILSVAPTPPDVSDAVRRNLDRARRWVLKNLGEECSEKTLRKAGGNLIQFESDAEYISRIALNHPEEIR